MKLRTILAATALGAVAVPAAATAQNQPPPVNGGTQVGGLVSSFLELSLIQPKTTFKTFKKPKTYSSSFGVAVTTTEDSAFLSLGDGEVASGSKLGHLTSGSKRLPLSLEARAGKAKFQRLDSAVSPLLAKFDNGTRMPGTVSLRQRVKSKASGSYRKVLLVTLSTETP
jgi:hypothetical protein